MFGRHSYSLAFPAWLAVVFLMAIGFVARRAGFIRGEAARHRSSLVFMVMARALLFRTMRTVHVAQLNFKPAAM